MTSDNEAQAYVLILTFSVCSTPQANGFKRTGKRMSGAFFPGGTAVALLRAAVWLRAHGLRPLAKLISALNFILTSVDAVPTLIVGHTFGLPHPAGVVLGGGCRIGNGVTIYQHVTLGQRHSREAVDGFPTLEDDVTVFAGAILIGPITVGRGSVVGANAIVLADVPPGATVYGIWRG